MKLSEIVREEVKYNEAREKLKGRHAMLSAAFMAKAIFTLITVLLIWCTVVCF